jgi:hypothetical protein
MFFGKIITAESPFIYSEETVDAKIGEVISISNVALCPSSKVLLLSTHSKMHLCI